MKKIFIFLLIPVILFLFVAADFPEKIEKRNLPVLMYHSVSNQGKSTYILSPEKLEQDFIALKKAGYTTVTAEDLYAFIDGKSLPEKIVLLTFDDGHYNNLLYLLPLLEKYDFYAIVNVIGSFSNYASETSDNHCEHSYLTWEDIKILEESGRVEIGNHTYKMHSYSPRFGIGRIKNEDDETYIQKLTDDINTLNGKLKTVCKKPITVFAYPFGRYNTLAQNTLIGLGFKMTLTCYEGVNTIEQFKPETLIHLKRFNRDSKYTTEKVMSLIAS